MAFVLLYIPNFLRDGGAERCRAAAATSSPSVDGREITVGQFRRVYQQQMQAYRRSYGGNIDEQLLKQLGIDQRILQQMIDEEAALAEARRLGITASDEEVRDAHPRPAGVPGERAVHRRRALSAAAADAEAAAAPAEFEEQVRRSITVEKLQAALTDWITVHRQGRRRRNTSGATRR